MSTKRSSLKTHSLNLHDSIRAWLTSWDFLDNPFASWQAEQEPWLERYFVRPPFYEQLLTSHKSTLAFAPRGGGKTATRLMIQSECRPNAPSSPVFAFSFTDFSSFVENSAIQPHLSLNDYLPGILNAALHQLLKATSQLYAAGGKFSEDDWGELRYWIENYAEECLSVRYLPKLVQGWTERVSRKELETWAAQLLSESAADLPDPLLIAMREIWQRLQIKPRVPVVRAASPMQSILQFVAFVCQLLSRGRAECRVVYLLVDGIDEYAITQNDPSASSAILHPLLGNLRFLETPQLAVKFFLPSEQRANLERHARIDRLAVYTLAWERESATQRPESIRELLRRRIAFFNELGMENLGEMCVSEMRHWIEAAMLEEGGNSPRNVLRLGNLLFAEHCRDIPAPRSEIQFTEWERAIEGFRKTKAQTSTTHFESASHSLGTPETWVALLTVDVKTGQVFRGSEEVFPPLPDLEFRLLAFLYENMGKICSRKDIIRNVYGPLLTGEVVHESQLDTITDQTIGSLVYRVRKRIEPSGYTEPIYLKTVAGRGFRLENVK